MKRILNTAIAAAILSAYPQIAMSAESPMRCSYDRQNAKITCSITEDEVAIGNIQLNRGNCSYPLNDDIGASMAMKETAKKKIQAASSDGSEGSFRALMGCSLGIKDGCDMLGITLEEMASLRDFRGTYKFGDQFVVEAISCPNLLEYSIDANGTSWTWQTK